MLRARLAVFSLGLSAVVLQLTALRGFYSSFDGNELVFAVVFGGWLLLTGLGGLLGRFSGRLEDRLGLFLALQLLLSLLLPAVVFLSGVVRDLVAVRGGLVSLPLVFLSSIAVLAPYCLLSGFQIVFSLGLMPEGGRKVGLVYSTEALGSLAGGLLFSFILVTVFDPFQIAYLMLSANLLVCTILAGNSRRLMLLVGGVALISLLFINSIDLKAVSNVLHYPGQQVLFQGDSHYGIVALTNSSGQLNLYENGVPLRSSGITMDVEESVHYGMVQHPNPRRVLVISGGFQAVREVLKYNSVREVDYVELDPLVLEVESSYMDGMDDPRVRLRSIDGRVFVKQEAASGVFYDVVLVNLPDPSNAQVGRFYTVEFFREVKSLLSDDGVLSISVSSGENYLTPEARKLNACVYRTLEAVFRNILLVPGGRNYYLASDRTLTYDIAGIIEKLGLGTYYVNRYYLEGTLTPERIQYALDSITGEEAEVNADFKPVSYYYYMKYWAGYFKLDIRLIAAVLLLAFALAAWRLKPLQFGVYTAGFSAASLEIILVIAFQVLYGVAYRWLGVLVTAFMLGLYLGSRRATGRDGDVKTVRFLVFCIGVFSIALPAVVYSLAVLPAGAASTAAQLAFPLLAGILGLLAGSVLPTAGSVYVGHGRSAGDVLGVLYFLDLFGAFFGSMLAGILLIPLLGITYSSLIISVLNLIGVYRLRRGEG